MELGLDMRTQKLTPTSSAHLNQSLITPSGAAAIPMKPPGAACKGWRKMSVLDARAHSLSLLSMPCHPHSSMGIAFLYINRMVILIALSRHGVTYPHHVVIPDGDHMRRRGEGGVSEGKSE